MAKLGVVPKLRLGNRTIVPGELDKRGNPKTTIVPTGSHKVKFLEEPQLIMGKNFEGNPRQEFKFIVEENGQKYRWQYPLHDKQGNPHYLLERTADITVGDVRILEMMSRGATKYIDIRKEGEVSQVPDELPNDEEYTDEEAQEELAKALEKEKQNE